MAKGRQKEIRVTINSEFYFTMDGRSMTLYQNDQLVGYFSQYEPMIRRILYLNALDGVTNGIPFTDYLDYLATERKKIEKLFESAVSPSGSLATK